MPYFHHTQPGHAYTFFYENYRGERERRHVIYRELSWGSNNFYPKLQFFFTGFDVDKKEVRSFSLGKIEITSFSRFTDQELHNHLNPPPEEEPLAPNAPPKTEPEA